MNQIADIVTRLLAAGTPPDVAAVAVAEAFAAGASSVSGGSPVDKATEKRRAYDRERKAKQREHDRKSGGSPVEVGGSPETASSLSNNKQIQPIEKEKKKRGEKLPPDWQPKLEHDRQSVELGHDHRWMLVQAEDMRLWARANEHRAVARKLDWDLTFTSWMRRNARPTGRPPPNRPPSFHEIARNLSGTPDDEPSDKPDYDLDLRANFAH